ncbi:MAG: bile acid:sodium symporter family protein [Gemmatimonadaceae bacterium]|nr:bile acid:sodium symporter family protein [Gemmatimonadaceae bacterium]
MGLRFDPAQLVTLNVVLAVMMYGVSLTLRPADFLAVLHKPLAPAAGLVAQFLLLPAASTAIAWALRLDAELALGMILVASCPGGSFSNLMAYRARGDVALSVSMTAVSSLAATLLTPLNFAFWASVNPVTRDYLRAIAVPPGGIFIVVLLVLGLPLALGMWTGQRYPRFAMRMDPPLRRLALLVLLAFVAIAFAQNLTLFVERFGTFFYVVVLQNLLALSLGYASARALRLGDAATRAVTLEVGIQNSGLGLVILFTFFPEAGGMLLVTAFWGVWHLVTGIALSSWWARRPAEAAA